MKRTGIVEKKKVHGLGDQPKPRLLPLKGAAEYSGLTIWCLRERIWAGDIPVVRFPGGRKQFLDVKDLDKFIEDNKTVIT